MGLALFQRMSLAAVARDLIDELGLSASEMGALGSFYFYPYALLQIPVGLLVERWGPRRLISLSLSIAGIGGLIFALAPDFLWISIGRTLIGFGMAGIFIPSLKLISVWFPARDIALWTGIHMAIAGCGVLFAGRPLVELVLRFGWSNAFLMAAIITLFMAGASWLIIRDESHSCFSDTTGGSVTQPRPGRRDFAQVIRSPTLYLMGLGGFLIYGVHASFQAIWAGPFLRDVVGASPAVVGNLLMLLQIGQITGSLVFGWIADRVLRSRVSGAIVGSSFFVACWLLLATRLEALGLPALAGIHLGMGFTFTAYLLVFPLVRGRYPPAVASTALGTVNLLGMLGGAAMQQFFGLLLDRFASNAGAFSKEAYESVFLYATLLAGIGVISLSVGMLRSTRRQKHTEEE